MRLYSCGPTVYDHTHLGHMRAYIAVDILRRTLKYLSYEVNHVMNITDVGHLRGDRDMGEDKLESAAKKKAKTAWEIAREYEEEFFTVMDGLNIKRPGTLCRATEYIEPMIELVKVLEKKGFTYRTSDGIYFDTSKMPDYNGLSKLPLEELKEGARVEVNDEKKNPTDFALWKFTPKGEDRQMEWASPWAKKSFPGWHIECSAMSRKHLGDRIDIHTGGVDHIHVHHTNERAQNWASTGHRVVNWWVHNEFLMVEGKKMSKSLGNFLIASDIEKKGFVPLSIRYLFLTVQYRRRTNFTWKSLAAAQTGLGKLQDQVLKLEGESVETLAGKKFEKRFAQALEDDLNLTEALAIGWEVLKSKLSDGEKHRLLISFDRVLGLDLGHKKKLEVSQEVVVLANRREEARQKQDWKQADMLRDKLKKLGFEIEDHAEGYRLKKK